MPNKYRLIVRQSGCDEQQWLSQPHQLRWRDSSRARSERKLCQTRADRLLVGMRFLAVLIAACFALSFASCKNAGVRAKQLTLAVNSGVEGDALKQAALDYEAVTGIHVSIAEFPYENLFEKELIDLTAKTGAYDLIMLDDPWFPRF